MNYIPDYARFVRREPDAPRFVACYGCDRLFAFEATTSTCLSGVRICSCCAKQVNRGGNAVKIRHLAGYSGKTGRPRYSYESVRPFEWLPEMDAQPIEYGPEPQRTT